MQKPSEESVSLPETLKEPVLEFERVFREEIKEYAPTLLELLDNGGNMFRIAVIGTALGFFLRPDVRVFVSRGDMNSVADVAIEDENIPEFIKDDFISMMKAAPDCKEKPLKSAQRIIAKIEELLYQYEGTATDMNA